MKADMAFEVLSRIHLPEEARDGVGVMIPIKSSIEERRYSDGKIVPWFTQYSNGLDVHLPLDSVFPESNGDIRRRIGAKLVDRESLGDDEVYRLNNYMYVLNEQDIRFNTMIHSARDTES